VSELVVPRRAVRTSGWWGMALFLATEVTLFGTIFGTYFYLRLNAVVWPPHGIDPPKPALPLVFAGLLASTSLLLVRAGRRAAAERVAPARLALLGALVVQCGCLCGQLVLLTHDLDRMQPSQSAYASIYFTMLGAHAAHVFAGLLLEAWLLARLARGLTSYRLVALRTTALYWHVVNVLALIVVAVQLSAWA
jgi:heme/copper-type cytochrome/quinol oxidase subunit 3